MLVEEAIEYADAAKVDQEFERRRERLRGFSKIAEHPLPKGLKAELRPYQKAGFDWLHFLHEYEFGGCLADDMGVGKTVQTLAFLLSLKDTGEQKTASLIVLPRSLIFNWECEVARFTPDLRVLIHAENKRAKDIKHLDDYDLVLTTYGVLLRDIELLRKYRFHYVVLDEAQTIKNPLAQTGRAARMLNADHRLVLTGTPVENSTIDLWSQFEFLNPGLLGSLEYFRQEFSAAIEKKQDDASAHLLRRMVFPFILRRTKDQVATDLPPRTEKILLAEMEAAQEKMYVKTRDKFRDELLGIISNDGMNNARMKILEALLRLRQISNHPKLMDADSAIESGKFELLMETLETLRAEGHKALVFSQFVRMLSIVRDRLDAGGVPYQYLDGQTKDRQARVDTFQSDPNIPFFLISLKAGGVGLNLTAADYVVHIDPWWNPAVERQATDRTHRIGQEKPVFVYKLITRGTVEEKILDLQERKRRLVDQLVAGEESILKSLTRDDVAVLFS
jgi:non-specific serine/threonine protein kinase